MTTPFDAAGAGLEGRALIKVLKPASMAGTIIPLCFNPTELKVDKQNNFSDVAIPGLDAPPVQFVRGNGERLTIDALADTSDTLEDVRVKYIATLRKLLEVESSLHAPPVVQFLWGTLPPFRSVIESLNVTYVLFTNDGVPIRARLALSLREYATIAEQVAKQKKASPDVDKAYTVRRGDTLSSIAADAYQDPEQWRTIARDNDIADPRNVAPGTVLSLPRIE